MIDKNKHLFGRIAGIAGVAIIWTSVGAGLILAKLGLFDARPISYLGVNPQTAHLFTFGLLASAILFAVYGLSLNKRYQLNKSFLVIFMLGQVAQAVAALAPYGDGSPTKIPHTIAAFVLAFSLPLAMRSFSQSNLPTNLKPAAIRLYEIEKWATIVGLGAFILIKGVGPISEILTAITFDIWILRFSLL